MAILSLMLQNAIQGSMKHSWEKFKCVKKDNSQGIFGNLVLIQPLFILEGESTLVPQPNRTQASNEGMFTNYITVNRVYKR